MSRQVDPPSHMIDLARKILATLGPSSHRQLYLVLALILVMSMIETLGVASIMPFIAVLSDPASIDRSPYLSFVFRELGFSSRKSFVFFLGVATVSILVGSIALRALTLWAQVRFTDLQTHYLATRLVEAYLRRPYGWFLTQHTGDIGAKVLTEVTIVLQQAAFPMMNLIAHGVVALMLVVLLLSVDSILAALALLVLGGSYWLVFNLLKKFIQRLSDVRISANRARYKALNEIFGGIKDVKVSGHESTFLDRFRAPSERMARASIAASMVGEMPSFVMQSVVFGGMLVSILYLERAYGDIQGALPVIGLFALAGYRLMPALQGVYKAMTSIRYSSAVVEALYSDVSAFAEAPVTADFGRELAKAIRPIRLERKLSLRSVSFQYPQAERPALTNLSIDIDARTTVALVGSTGCGKTTTVDIIMGLLDPASGQLIVDEQEISPANLRAWQRNIGYVPQTVFLTDDTVAANIAFGVPPDEIDWHAVTRAAQDADLHDFVVSELPDGYQTVVGERGVRLSGGQRQRIAIARALYRDPDLLIFDEATSALDNVTEQVVMSAVYRLAKKKTVIMIAHRLSTVRSCDVIFLMQQGQIVASGSYDELLGSDERFREMALPGREDAVHR